MKTISASNWSPLRRALRMLFLGIVALLAMPKSAHARLYVGQFGFGNDRVGEDNRVKGFDRFESTATAPD